VEKVGSRKFVFCLKEIYRWLFLVQG